MVAKPNNAAVNQQLNLLSIRQHAVNVALEVAKFSHDEKGRQGNAAGLLNNAQSIEQFVLNGTVPPAVVPVAPTPAAAPAKRVRK